MKILIKNGKVIDPSQKLKEKMDILIEGDSILSFSRKITVKADKIIDAEGMIIAPGFIDVHAHLREPGHEEEETIASGTRSAAKGGITTVFCMPNTHPPLDNAPAVEFVLLKAQKEGLINVHPIGCITKNSQGEALAEIGKLKKAGVIAISDDGNSVMNAQMMRRALEYSKKFRLAVIAHSEDMNLSKNGAMNEGYTSTMLGLRGIPHQSEEVMIARDIMLSELTGGHLHLAHVSTRGSVELIRQAKSKNIKVTAETCPHYFSLTEECVKNYDTNTKMKPPLRTKADVDAIKEGLRDGTIDCIATDHAPHTEEEKNMEYDSAPFGIIGFETMLALVVMELIDTKVLDWPQAIDRLSCAPAKIFGLNGRGTLRKGAKADIVIIDPAKKFVFTKNSIVSKSKNSPFINFTMKGASVCTIAGGNIVWQEKTKS